MLRRYHGEVGVQTCFDTVAHEGAVVIKGCVALGNHFSLFDFGCQVYYLVVVEVDLGILHLTVRRLDKAQVVDLGINAERRYKTDIRAFRRLNRAQTAIVGIVHVAHLETGSLTRKSARTQGRHTALVGHLGQRVGLVHELRQRIRTEERVDDRRYGLGVDKVDGCEHLVVAYVHTLADGARHTGQSHAKLVVKLLAHGAHAAVAQVVDIVDIGLRVDKLDEVLDDFDDIFLGEHLDFHRGGQSELLVDSVAAHLA